MNASTLIKSDLYRVAGRTGAAAFLKHYVFTKGFQYWCGSAWPLDSDLARLASP